jgi:3-methyladenine DNA glycosylase AlkD
MHGYSFSSLQLQEQLYIWDYIWHQSDVFEIKSQALFFLDKYYSKVDALLLWNTIKQWTSTIDNWAHSDGLSKIYSHMLELLGKNVYAQLEKWNTSSNPWERRQSIVSLLYYRRNRKVFLAFEAYISLIDLLLTDKNYYVQKGIGWTLRELLQQYESETFEYIMAHAHLITSTAYYATAEKMTETQKEQFKLLRKKIK